MSLYQPILAAILTAATAASMASGTLRDGLRVSSAMLSEQENQLRLSQLLHAQPHCAEASAPVATVVKTQPSMKTRTRES